MKSFFISLLIILFSFSPVYAFWVWTPETNKWVNPKFAVKETPQEQLKYALEFYEAGESEKAVAEFRKLIRHYPRAREAADAQYYIGLILEKQEKLIAAFKEYQIVIEKYPFSERAGEIVKRQYEIGNLLLEGKDKKNKIVHTIMGGDHDIVEVFRAVIKNAPYGEYAAAAQYKIGLYLQEKQLFQEARDEFEKTINDYPDSEWAKAAKFQIALSDSKRSADAAYDQKVTKSAIDEFQDFVKEYPEAELTADAKDQIHKLKEKEAENNFLVAQFYEKQKKYKAAKVYYNIIVEDYKNTAWSKKALTELRRLNEIQE